MTHETAQGAPRAHLELLQRLPYVRVAEPVRFPSGTGAGQRTATRRALNVHALVRELRADQDALPLELDEVSATGAFVCTPLLLPVGAAVEVSFTLPTLAGSISAPARVVRVEESADRPGYAIEFERMAPTARAHLRSYTRWH